MNTILRACIVIIIMHGWQLDTAIAGGSIILLLACLVVLPGFLPDAMAYIGSIAIFIIILSIAGYRVLEKVQS